MNSTTLNFTFLMTMWIRNKVTEIVIVSSLAVSPILYIIYACNNLILFHTNCLRMESKHLYTINLWGYAPN